MYNSHNKDIYNLITDSRFNPKKISYINKENLNESKIKVIENIQYDDNAFVEIIKWDPDKIIFSTKASSPQLLFLSEIFYPGWRVSGIDSEPIKINEIFRGLIVPQGDNMITLEFKPNDIFIGMWINIFSLFIIILLGFIGYRNNREYV